MSWIFAIIWSISATVIFRLLAFIYTGTYARLLPVQRIFRVIGAWFVDVLFGLAIAFTFLFPMLVSFAFSEIDFHNVWLQLFYALLFACGLWNEIRLRPLPAAMIKKVKSWNETTINSEVKQSRRQRTIRVVLLIIFFGLIIWCRNWSDRIKYSHINLSDNPHNSYPVKREK